MRMLSQLIANSYCPAATPQGPDRFFSVGCSVVGSHWRPADAADAARVASQAKAVSTMAWSPWEPDQPILGVFNDLFSPFRESQDGKLFVWIPVPVEEQLSSTLMARDWRVFAMAWWAARRVGAESGRIHVTAFDSARRNISCDIGVEDLYSAFEAMAGMSHGPQEIPGASCGSCSRAPTCRGLEAFVADYGPMPGPSKGATDEVRVRRLFVERTAVSMKLEHLEKRKDVIDAELSKAVKDGLLKLGDGEDMVVPTRTTSAYDFGMVHRALMSRGLWDDSFGTIRGGELQKRIEGYPVDLAKALEKARTERTSQPSISEAARHGRFAARAPFLGGVALQGKGGLGKGK